MPSVTTPPSKSEYEFVQATEPAEGSAGSLWLDTSVDPPEPYVRADLGTGLVWVQVGADVAADNLDAPVSSRSDHADPDPNNRLDAAVSSRSSHDDPDPNDRLDAPVSSRSDHADPDPNNRLDAAVSSRSGHADPDPNGNISNLDTAVSSRSSHGDPDPNNRLDADVSSRSSHSAADVFNNVSGGVDWASKTPKVSGSDGPTVSGSGYLTSVVFVATDNATVDVTIDGTTTSLFVTGASTSPTPYSFKFLHRFETGFSISNPSNIDSTGVTYVLD
jgi:hypothetical protein